MNSFTVKIQRKDQVLNREVNKDMFTVGRSLDCDISLNDSHVSRVHVVVSRRWNQIWIEDKNSSNGTFVNGTKIVQGSPVNVVPSDKIQIGKSEYILSIDLQTDEAEVPETPATDTSAGEEPVEPTMAMPPPQFANPFQAEKLVHEAKRKAAQIILEGETQAEKRVQVIYQNARESQAKAELFYQTRISEAHKEADAILLDYQKQGQILLQEARTMAQELREEVDMYVQTLRQKAKADADEIISGTTLNMEKLKADSLEAAREQGRRESESLIKGAKEEADRLIDFSRLQAQETQEKVRQGNEELERIKAELAKTQEKFTIATEALDELVKKDAEIREFVAKEQLRIKALAEEEDLRLRGLRSVEEEKLKKEREEQELKVRSYVDAERNKIDSYVRGEEERVKSLGDIEREKVDSYVRSEQERIQKYVRDETEKIDSYVKSEQDRLKKIYDEENARLTKIREEEELRLNTTYSAEDARIKELLAGEEARVNAVISKEETRVQELIALEEKRVKEILDKEETELARIRNEHQSLSSQNKTLEESVQSLQKSQAHMTMDVREIETKKSNLQREYDAKKNEIVDKLEKEKEQLIKQDQERIEEMRVDMAKRLQKMERELMDEVMGRKEGLVKEIFSHIEREVVSVVEPKKWDGISANVQARITEAIEGKVTSMSQSSVTSVKPVNFMRKRKIERFRWVASGFAAASILFFSGQSIVRHLLENPTPMQTAAEADAKRRAEDLERRKFNPEQTEEVRDSYTDSVIYTSNYVSIFSEEEFQKNLYKATSQYLLKTWRIDEDKSIQVISVATALVKELAVLRSNIHPDYVKNGIDKMRDLEAQTLARMKDILGTEVRVESYRRFEKNFYKEEVHRRQVAQY